MGYIYFIIDLPSAWVWDCRKKLLMPCAKKAGETAAGGWSDAGALAGAMHHPADRLEATTGEISTAVVAEPVTRIPCLKAGVNSLMTSIIHNQ
jgi:hypothetical protein